MLSGLPMVYTRRFPLLNAGFPLLWRRQPRLKLEIAQYWGKESPLPQDAGFSFCGRQRFLPSLRAPSHGDFKVWSSESQVLCPKY